MGTDVDGGGAPAPDILTPAPTDIQLKTFDPTSAGDINLTSQFSMTTIGGALLSIQDGSSIYPGRRKRVMRLVTPACAVLLLGQVSGGEPTEGNPDYRGQVVFTRIRYGASADAFPYFGGRNTWSHDYPRADFHLSRLLSELTTIDANVSSTNVLTLDDPELFRHPIAYISEPGFWTLRDEDAASLRSYLLKGGFLIFDDFEQEQWYNFEAQMMRVVPDHRLVELDVSHPIFRSFFEMRSIDFPHPLVNVMPTYYGIFEDNDPKKRLMAIVNYNNDIAEYWEWSDAGWFPIEITNEAYKLGINYMVYALTH